MVEVAEDVTEKMGRWGLIRATVGSRPRNDNKKVEGKAQRSDAEDNRCDRNIDLPEVPREGRTEEQQRSLQHQRQRLHHMVKIPRDDPTQFLLSVVAPFNS